MTKSIKSFLVFINNSLTPAICNFYKFPRVSCDCIFFCKFPPQTPIKISPSKLQNKILNHSFKGIKT